MEEKLEVSKKEGNGLQRLKYKYCQYIILIIFYLLASCTPPMNSIDNILGRGEFIEQNSIQKGMLRVDLLERFGNPIEREDDKRFDVFQFEQGEKDDVKNLKVAGAFLLIVGTFGLADLILDPITKEKPMVVFEVTYDNDEHVDTVKYLQLPKSKE